MLFWLIADYQRKMEIQTKNKKHKNRSARGEAMNVRIDKELCTGCEECLDICEDVFEMADDDNVAILKINEIPKVLEDEVGEAAESCPAEAIIIDD